MAAGSTYTPIATYTLPSAAASYTFSSISGSYTDLILVGTANNNQGVAYISTLTFNADSGSNYSYIRMVGTGTAGSSSTDSGATYGYGGWSNNQSNQYNISINHFQNYSNSTTYKTWLGQGGDVTDRVYFVTGVWRNTAAITSISFNAAYGSFVSGSSFALYGIKGG